MFIDSNYYAMYDILHSITDKLGCGEILSNKFNDAQLNEYKVNTFIKLRKVIKDVNKN